MHYAGIGCNSLHIITNVTVEFYGIIYITKQHRNKFDDCRHMKKPMEKLPTSIPLLYV